MPLKECPFCLREILMAALECPECGKRIAGAGTPAGFRKRLLVQELTLRQAIREGKVGASRGGLLGALRMRTLTASGATGLCLCAELLAVTNPELARLASLAIPGGILTLVLLAYFAIGDLAWLAVRRRRTPAHALSAFVRALEIGRYEEASGCVLPGDRNPRPRLRRAIHAISLGSARCSFADAAGFRAYWRPVFTAPDSSLTLSRPQVVREEGDLAVVSAELSIRRRAGGWGGGLLGAALRSAMAKEDEIKLTKLVRKVDGRWYLVNGEIQSPEDGALEEFATLAAASDERLVELTRQLPAAEPANAASAADVDGGEGAQAP
ncbi:MAG TPA: hypothetical protein PK280_10695 [Planctomycetota bacterium]|nr:hypothetical protein [Planctomycetota bacterium]